MKVQRLAAITKVFAEEGLGQLLGQSGPDGAGPSSDAQTAGRLRRALEKLGPTFVKFGQILATRIDLFGDEFTAELGKLHATVAPFDHDVAMAIVAAELKRPVGEVFAEMPPAPVAAASIAQVYKARLLDGTVVAVKVQRPGLDENLLQDLDVLVTVSGWLDKLVPPYNKAMVHLVAQEYARRAQQELQFLSEVAAIERFSAHWRGDDYFAFPRVFKDLCSDRLIVMEWLEGVKVDKLRGGDDLRQQGFDPPLFARHMLRLQLCMSYEHGFVHADTHPGNLILLPTGKVGLIDFGLHATISRDVQAKIIESLYYQSQGRIEEALDATIEFSPPADPRDLEPFKAELRELMKRPTPKTGAVVSAQLISSMRIGAKYKAVASSEIIMIIRNLAIVEGIYLRFCPEFEPNAAMTEILQGILKRKFSFERMQEDMKPLLGSLAITLSRRPELIERLLRMERTFIGSKNLGDFLRREGVLAAPEERQRSVVAIAAAFALGALAAGAAFWLRG